MAITHTSRTGKTYYLHTGPKRGGGIQYYCSTKPTGQLADGVPEGYEIYETVNGQVYLRRQQPKLVRDAELDAIRRSLEKPRAGHLYKVEERGKAIIVHESPPMSTALRDSARHLSLQEQERLSERFAHYQALLRFTLVDRDKRLFAPERYCFRGSVEDWIPVGPPDTIDKLAADYLKHLGHESFYELF